MTMTNQTRLAPTLGGTDSGDAPALGGTRGRALAVVGMATPLRLWVFRAEKKYNAAGGRYVLERVVGPRDHFPDDTWAEMELETFDNGFSSWGGEVDGYYTLDVSTYHRRPEPVFRLHYVPAWITRADVAETWHDMATGHEEARDWLDACPRLATIVNSEERWNVQRFLATRPRKAERAQLKLDLVAWLNGEREYPVEASWMTRPYELPKRW